MTDIMLGAWSAAALAFSIILRCTVSRRSSSSCGSVRLDCDDLMTRLDARPNFLSTFSLSWQTEREPSR